MRKNAKLILAGMMTLSLVGCAKEKPVNNTETMAKTETVTETATETTIEAETIPDATVPSDDITTEASEEITAQIANPYLTLESKEAVEEEAGFSITLPEHLPSWVEDTVYRVSVDNLIEVIYTSEDEKLRIRKAEGSENISGVYDNSGSEKEVEACLETGGRIYTLKSQNDMVNVATWVEDGYTYSVTMHLGMPEEDYLRLLNEIK